MTEQEKTILIIEALLWRKAVRFFRIALPLAFIAGFVIGYVTR